MQVELSKQEIETVLKCVKAHITTLNAVISKDTSAFQIYVITIEKIVKRFIKNYQTK